MRTTSGESGKPVRGRLWIAVFLICLAIVAALGFGVVNWTFTKQRIVESLGASTGSTVRIGRFRRTFFPSPGCVIDNVSFGRGSATQLAKADRITIQSTWGALATFSRQVRLLRTEGLYVRLPHEVPPPIIKEQKGRDSPIAQLVANGAVLEIGNTPVRFEFEELTIENASKRERMLFETKLRGSHVPGDIRVKGSFGPWEQNETALSGSFRIANADLGRYPGIAGLLSSSGEMKGTLSHLTVQGESDTADFQVNGSPNKMRLRAVYGLTVNGLSGDVVIERAEAKFLQTTLYASGSIAGTSGKTIAVDFDGRSARIQDLLWMFTSDPRPALNGPIVLRAHVELPPGPGKFLKKLRLDGRCGIDNARFTRETTQSKLNQISARARSGKDRGEDNDDPRPASAVLSEIEGVVTVRNGIAQLSDVSFRVPGAHATGAGRYDLLSKQIDLRGRVALDASLSEASGGGWKSVFLKPLNFFFKKEHAGAVAPVLMTGKYPKPKLQISLTGKK